MPEPLLPESPAEPLVPEPLVPDPESSRAGSAGLGAAGARPARSRAAGPGAARPGPTRRSSSQRGLRRRPLRLRRLERRTRAPVRPPRLPRLARARASAPRRRGRGGRRGDRSARAPWPRSPRRRRPRPACRRQPAAPAPPATSATRAAGWPAPRASRASRRARRGQRRRGGPERPPAAHHELSDGAMGEAERAGDLVLRPALDGDAQQRFALTLGQRSDVGQRTAQRHPALELVLRVNRPRRRVRAARVVHPRGVAQRVERDVVQDPVQPRVQVAHVVAALERRPRGQETPAAPRPRRQRREQSAPVAEQRAAVALHDRLERMLVPCAASATSRSSDWVLRTASEAERTSRRPTQGPVPGSYVISPLAGVIPT